MHRSPVLRAPLLLPFSSMGLGDEDPRSELAQEERARRTKAPLLRCLVAQEQVRIEADARTKRLRQEMRQDLAAYNLKGLQTESEALDLRTEAPLHRSAVSVHQRIVNHLDSKDKTAPPPPSQKVVLETRTPPTEKKSVPTPWQPPARSHLDSLVVTPRTTSTSAPPLAFTMNPIMSHLDTMVNIETGVQLPPFCLLTRDLPPLTLNLPRKTGAGSAALSNIARPPVPSGTKPLPIPAGRLRDRRLGEIREGILQHNQECRETQDRLNRERQRLHRLAVRYGLGTNLWTAIILMIPIILHEVGSAESFRVYDCSQDQLKTQTIDLTEPKNCKDPETDYHPAKSVEIKIIMTDGDTPVMATQCVVRKTQEVFRCGGLPSFHYGAFKVTIDQPVEVTPQECREALAAGRITVQGQNTDFQIGKSKYLTYYSEGGRARDGTCTITTFTRNGVTYYKSYEETTIQILITRVRGTKLGKHIKFPSGLAAPHEDGVVRDAHDGLLIWDTRVLRCQDRMSLMYSGTATLHRARSSTKDGLEEAIVLVAQNETHRYAGLVLEGKKHTCGHTCHKTQLLGVVACMEDDPNKQWTFQKGINHEEANLLSHVHFLHLSRGLGNFQRFEDFQEAVCQVERKSLFNKLQSLAAGNKYALHDIYGPGFQIYLSGSVAYVAQCIPEEARLYDPVNCTQEIPAEIGSADFGNLTKRYANAQTMILQDFPTRVPCTKDYPPKWKIDGVWFCSYPLIAKCNDAPTQLNLTYDHSFRSMKTIFEGIKGGILRNSQLQGSRLWRQLAQCKEAVAHALAYTALYNSPSQEILGEPLDQSTMRKVAFASAMMTTPFFAVFGWTWFYLSALMGLFTILNYVFSVTLRIIGLWKERGFGWWLLGGLWAAAYNLLLLPTTVVKNIMTFNREQAEKALPMTIVTTGSASPKNDAGALPSLGGAGSDAEGNVETSSPYDLVNSQLSEARAKLVAHSIEANEKLVRVHQYYERKLELGLSPSAPEGPQPGRPE